MRKFQNLGPCEKTCDSNKPVKITLSKTYDKVWENILKTPLKNPLKKPWNKFWENCLRNTSGKLYENTCEQKMKWNEMKKTKSKTEIYKDTLRIMKE